jgi:hypothetical protein
MTVQKVTYLIFILFTVTSCYKTSPISEEKILGEIFPQLIDSLRIKCRFPHHRRDLSMTSKFCWY